MPAGDRYLVTLPGKEKLLAEAFAALGYPIAAARE